MIKKRVTTRKLSRKYRRHIVSFLTAVTKRTLSRSQTCCICGKKIKDVSIEGKKFILEHTKTCDEYHLDPESCNCALASGKRNMYVNPSRINRILTIIKYPKLMLFALFFISSYLFFANNTSFSFRDLFSSVGYLQTYFAGFFYAFGFTAIPATAILTSLPEDLNIILAGFIGGIGAVTGDLILFLFIRSFFTNEIKLLFESTSFRIKMFTKGIIENIKKITQHRFIKILYPLNKKMSYSFRRYLYPVIGGLIIASPLPTELGVTMMASSKKISLKKFTIIVFILHTLAIVSLIVYSTV